MSDLLEVDCHRLRDEGKENTNREVVGRKGPAGDHTSLLARKWNHQNWLQHLFPHQKLRNSEVQWWAIFGLYFFMGILGGLGVVFSLILILFYKEENSM